MLKNLKLRYTTPAARSDEGWEKYSLPIGNGYFGASVFGGTDIERIQFTTNTFANTFRNGGVSNFGELFIDFSDAPVTDYERTLDLTTGIVSSHYNACGNKISREAFFSYPDKVFAYRIVSEHKTDLTVRLEIPYLDRPVSEGGREGRVTGGDTLVMRGRLPARDLLFEGVVAVVTNGTKRAANEQIRVEGATDTVLFFAADTSYVLCPETFLSGCNKALGGDPHEAVAATLENALSLGWEALTARHVADYSALMGRVELNLGGVDDGRATDELLLSLQKGNFEPYLEELYYQYGRHLLVCSSRKGTPPSSLQGVWTVHDRSPWGSGFWHNINVQMNYWHAFSTNLAETFLAYADYHRAYLKQAQINASEWIQETNPENYQSGEGACGWIIGTGAFCYEIEGRNPASHSGPGTGGLTAKLFWDFYDFTRDKEVFENYTLPAVHGMSEFLTKCVREYDGRYLCSFSASPEQILSGSWVNGHKMQQYYHTVGCAFDQQMLYENARDDLKCAAIAGLRDDTVKREEACLERYSPVQIGYSGQIKEYDEEHFYGEIGEAKHRHLSQLVALMPGTQITHKTPAWLDSARHTLDLRGDESTGWALAHRLCARARAGDGDRAYSLLKGLLAKRTHPNLWDVHPPFQIDGNFGAVAGMTEMLLQSHEDCIALLPSVPKAWQRVCFRGLKARGNFTVACEYEDGRILRAEIVSCAGGRACVRVGESAVAVTAANGKQVATARIKNDCIAFETVKGEAYTLTGFAQTQKGPAPSALTAEWAKSGVSLKWQGEGNRFTVYRAVENDPTYTLLITTGKRAYTDREFDAAHKKRLTYKVVCGDENAAQEGAVAFLDPADDLERERYAFRFRTNNLNL